MTMYEITCAVCGKVFSSENSNAKYCSPLCRVDGAKHVRKEWEQNSRYQEKQRERMRGKRQEERRAIEEMKKARRNHTISIVKKEEADRERRFAEEIQAKVKQGDVKACQMLALERGDTLEYWRLYKEQLLQTEKEFGNVGRHSVGGVDVHEEHFEHLVVAQLKQNQKEGN